MQTTTEIRTRLSSVHATTATFESEQGVSAEAANTPPRATEPQAAGSGIFEHLPAPRLLDLIELILKDRPRLERVIRDPSLAAELIPRFLGVSLIGFTLFGITMTLVFHAVEIQATLNSIKSVLEGSAPSLIIFEPRGNTSGFSPVESFGAALRLIAAYDLGLIAAAGVCLPSLYFYGLLAGVSMSIARVTVHTVKAMSTTAVALVGILPIYMAFSLGAAVFQTPRMFSDSVLWLGLGLPFVAGLFGVHSLFIGFTALADGMPPECRTGRACLLRRLVVSWSVCYTAVTPVMIFTLWEYFSR